MHVMHEMRRCAPQCPIFRRNPMDRNFLRSQPYLGRSLGSIKSAGFKGGFKHPKVIGPQIALIIQ